MMVAKVAVMTNALVQEVSGFTITTVVIQFHRTCCFGCHKYEKDVIGEAVAEFLFHLMQDLTHGDVVLSSIPLER